MAFLGKISDKRLQSVLSLNHPMILHYVKRILGKQFVNAYHRYRANPDILTFLLAMLLYMMISKQKTKLLTQMVFEHCFLGEIDVVLDNVDSIIRLPFPKKLLYEFG